MATATTNSYFGRSNNYSFLTDASDAPIGSDSIFEFEESDVWSSVQSPASIENRKPRISRTNSGIRSGARREVAGSVPVNVPDWSKILKQELRRRDGSDDVEDDGSDEDGECRIPPHEFLARQLERTRIASFSLHEGRGRTLKGRDLSRVRNAIWEKIGFQD